MKKKIPPRRSSGKKKARSPKKMVYRVSNWSTYNQALIDRGSLRVWLSEEALSGWHYQGPTQRGAQFFYSDLAIETTLTLRKLFDLGLRQSQGLVTSLFALMRVDLKAPATRRCRVGRRSWRSSCRCARRRNLFIWSSIAVG